MTIESSPAPVGYRPRPTRCTGISDYGNWRLKRYEIAAVADEVLSTAGSAIDTVVANVVADEQDDELGVGFVVAHRGTEGVWLLIDLWRGDIICQRAFLAPIDDPTSFEPIEVGGPTVCVWEMELFIHERTAFIAYVLDRPAPDVAGYLADWFDNTAPTNAELVERFNRAWADGDVDGLMVLLADNPIYRASTGTGPGRIFTGAVEVRAGFATVIAAEASSGEPPAPPGRLHVFDDRALSFWSYPATGPSGGSVTVEGVDVWTFENSRIAVKDAYRKSFNDSQTRGAS